MAENKQVLLEFKVDGSEALQMTVALTDKLNQLKATKKDLEQQLKNDSGNQALKEQLAGVNAEIGATSTNLKGYQRELTNMVKANDANTESLKQQQAQLSVLTQRWDRLSEAERNSAKGQDLSNKINSTYENVSKLEQSTGRFQRNVGNYKSALEGAKGALQGLGVGASGSIGAIQGLGAAMKALIANPIGAIIAAIVLVLQALRKAFKENDDAGTNLQRAFSMFQPIIDAVKNAFSFLADILGKVALGISKVYKFIYGMLIPSYKDAADSAEELVIAQDKLQDKQREYTVESAKNNKKISENNAKIAAKDKYTAQQRIKMLQENAKLEKENSQKAMEIAQEEYRIAKAQADRKRKLSDEDKDRLADLQAKMLETETQYNDALVSINKKTSNAIKEINSENEKAEQEAARKRKEAADRYKQQQQEKLELQRQVEAGIVAAMNDGVDKQRAELKLNYKNQIEDYKKAMKEKPYLAKYYNELILQAEKDYAKQSADVIANAEKEKQRIKEEFAKGYTDIVYSNLMAEYAMEVDSYDKRQKVRKAQEAKELQDSQNAEQKALKDFQGTEEEKVALQEQYTKQRRLISQKYLKEQQDDLEKAQTDITKKFEKSMADLVGKTTIEAVHSQTQALISEQDELLKNQEITLEQYNNNLAKINEKSQQQIANISAANAISIGQAMNTAIGGIQSLMNEVAGDNEEMQNYMKALALAQIAISTGVSIVQAIQGATAAGAQFGMLAPAMIPIFIAELVGIVAGSVTSAVATMKKGSNVGSAPKFASGGYVSGAGTGTSDNILSWLSNGESVMTAQTTKMFAPMLSAMNVAGGGAPITQTGQNNAMRNMWQEAFADMPAPVVSVKEISNVSKRVQIKENISNNR